MNGCRNKKGRFTKKCRVDRTDLLKRNKSKDDECTAEEAFALLEDSSDNVFVNINPASDNVCPERIDIQGIRMLDYSYFAE